MAGQNIGKSTMTKADIVEKVYDKIGFSKKEASESGIGCGGVSSSARRAGSAARAAILATIRSSLLTGIHSS